MSAALAHSIWAVDVDTGALQWVHTRLMEGMRK